MPTLKAAFTVSEISPILSLSIQTSFHLEVVLLQITSNQIDRSIHHHTHLAPIINS